MAAADPPAPDLAAHLARSVAALAGDGPKQRFGVAVSGGPDSMALLDLAAAAFPGRVEAATVDHGLRPASAEEAAMVAQWCAAQSIPHVILHPAGPVEGNIQHWARAQRYALLAAWRGERRIDWIFTAHHADDQLETMLMRLNRGAGVNGLAGIRARQGHVLRPLLATRRAELLAHAERRGLPYVEDPSNRDLRFDRAAIRARLRSETWLDAQSAARSARALAEAEEALDWIVEGLEARHVRAEGSAWLIDRTDLPRELLRRLLLRVMARIDRQAPAPRGESLDRAILVAGEGGKTSLGNVLLQGGERWLVAPAPPRKGSLRKGSTD
ncbi:tRNA lysidine(34) synthetase TilS [Sphingobium mellinum]|uniref:tRNA lysidine(34) synthetase TilS n=1 Tax=Sphingobium mellinum TaxID=1387166 RepID=UPI0030EBBA88